LRRRLAGAVLILMTSFVLSRLLGLLRDIVIGYQFGTGREYEAYLAANRLPEFVFQVLAGGAVGSAFIPAFSVYLTQNNRDAAWRMLSTLFNLGALVVGAVSLALVLLADPVVRLIAPGFAPADQALASSLARIMLVGPLLFTLSTFAGSALNALDHFTLPALSPLLYNLAIIGGALAAPLLPADRRVFALAGGVAMGALLHLLIVVPGLVRAGMTYRPRIDWRDPGVREVGRLMLPRALGLAAMQVNFLVNVVLASQLPAGGLAGLNYAWLMLMLPHGVFSMALATAIFPTLSAQVNRGEGEAMRATLTRSLRLILFLTIPASLGLIVLDQPVVALLLQRGAFDAASTGATAFALRYYALGLAAYGVVEIVTRAFYACHDTLTPVLVSVLTFGLNIGLSLVLVGPLAQGGLALANALATTVEMLLLVFMAHRRLGGLVASEMGRAIVAILLATGVMGVAVWGVLQLTGTDVSRGFLANLVTVAAGAGAGSLVYLGVGWLLGLDEGRQVLAWLRRR